MSEPNVVLTLRRKRDQRESVILAYREKIAEAERDLSAVAATLRLFELNGEVEQFLAHLAMRRYFHARGDRGIVQGRAGG